VPTLISYVSQFMSLQPGDVISTGTPPGVGLGMKPPLFLKEGDVMELGIDKLGSVEPTATGASFELISDDAHVGTGTLAFDTAAHVIITLAADRGDSVSLASPLDDSEHLVGLGGQSFDVDHRGQRGTEAAREVTGQDQYGRHEDRALFVLRRGLAPRHRLPQEKLDLRIHAAQIVRRPFLDFLQ